MSTWFNEPDTIRKPVSEFDLSTVSFTYGDMFPVFNPKLDDGSEYRNTIYFFHEIQRIIDKYGYPEKVDYSFREAIYPQGTPINHFLKYIEAQVWSDEVVEKYREQWRASYSI